MLPSAQSFSHDMTHTDTSSWKTHMHVHAAGHTLTDVHIHPRLDFLRPSKNCKMHSALQDIPSNPKLSLYYVCSMGKKKEYPEQE